LQDLEVRVVPAAVVEFPVLQNNPGPVGITQGLNHLWVTEANANAIDEFSTDGTLLGRYFNSPNPGATPFGITEGPSRAPSAIDFTAARTLSGGMSEVEQLTPGRFILSHTNDDPKMITGGPDGYLWYTDTTNNRIARLDPANPMLAPTYYQLATGSSPWGIAAGQDGNIWFTELGFSAEGQFRPSMIGRINPTTGQLSEFAITTSPPTNPARPYDITATATGVAFTEFNANKVGVLHYDMTGFAESTIPTASSAPWGIATGPDGNLYFLEQAGNKVGWANASGVVQGEFQPLLRVSSQPTLITRGPDNNLWFTETGSNRIGKVDFSRAGQFRFVIGSPVAGQALPVIVQALDDSGAIALTYQGTVHMSSSDPQATLPDDYTFNAADMGQHTFTVTLRTAGSQSLAVADLVSGLVGSVNTTVGPAAAATLNVTGLAGNITSGSPASVTVTLLDPFGNRATGYLGTVSFSSSDPRATLPANYAFQASDNGMHVFTSGVVFRQAGAQQLTVSDIANPALTGRATTTVNPGAPARIIVTRPIDRILPGVPFTVRACIQDMNDNTVVGYTGRVHFSSTDSDPRVSLPADYQFTTADMGEHDFQVTLFTGGPQTITIAEIGTSGLQGSVGVIVDIFHSPEPAILVGQVPNAVVTADLNGDGIPDLITVNPGDGTISVLLGNGNGTFQPANTFADVDPNPWTVAVADLHGDGIPDLIVGHFDSSDLTIWTGTGNGTFINPVHIDGCPGCPGPVAPSLTPVIFNGVVNIVMTDFGGNVVSVLRGHGDGTFQAPILYPVGQGPSSVAAGDFNGDGIPDLVVTNYTSGTLSVLLGNADGTYEAPVNYAHPEPGPWSVAVADANGDGIPDLLVVNYTPPDPCFLVTWLGNGDGTFRLYDGDPPDTCPQPPPPHPPIPWWPPQPIVVGDFNGDGQVDVALPDYADNAVWVGLGNGRGGFQSGLLYAAGSGPVGLAAGDFNGDGLLDLAVANSQDNSVSILLNEQVPAGSGRVSSGHVGRRGAPLLATPVRVPPVGELDATGALAMAYLPSPSGSPASNPVGTTADSPPVATTPGRVSVAGAVVVDDRLMEARSDEGSRALSDAVFADLARLDPWGSVWEVA
jgi:streptogramin lyase